MFGIVAINGTSRLIAEFQGQGKLIRTVLGKLKYRFEFWSVLGQFPAKVGPGTVTDGPGLKHVA